MEKAMKDLSGRKNDAEKGGIVCRTGLLGGVYALNGLDPIRDIPNGIYLTGILLIILRRRS